MFDLATSVKTKRHPGYLAELGITADEFYGASERTRKMILAGLPSGGAVGTGAETMGNLPAQPYVTDPGLFFQLTSRNFTQFANVNTGAGAFAVKQLPQSGLLGKLTITWVGSVVVANDAGNEPVPGIRWPYGVLDYLKLNVNGQNELWNCTGEDLHGLRNLRYPAYEETVDNFPGAVGGGTALTNNTTYSNVSLTWEVPIAMDDLSLVGSLFAQSSSTNISATVAQAATAALFSANPTNATVSGTFYLEVEFFEVPFDAKGQLILPDLSRLHGFNAIDVPFTAVGDNKAFLIKSQGVLTRLLTRVRSATNNQLILNPDAASTKVINKWQFVYGANQAPYVFNPGSRLLSLNNQWYGEELPYGIACLDLVKENPTRDTIQMQGITEPAVIITVGSGVTVTAGNIHMVQETLF